MIRAIKRAIKMREVVKYTDLYHTTIGSLVTVLGILSQKTEEENYKYFKKLKKLQNAIPTDSLKTLVNWVNFNYTNVPEDLLQQMVYIYDERELKSPLFTIKTDRILPLTSNGTYTGILMEFLKEEVPMYIHVIEYNNFGEL